MTPSESGPEGGHGSCLAPGELLASRYRIVSFLGKGAVGEVYEAEDLELADRIAIKTLRPEIARDERVLQRFKREIQLARRVTHPNVCRIFDVGLHRPVGVADKGELAFLTMELLDGETISQRLQKSGRFSTDQARAVVAQVSAALDAAHQVGVIHRDFKSSNVMLVQSHGRVRAVVTDFGLARGRSAASDPTITGDGGVVGSPSYMAPEQVEGREIGAAADIYALGIVMYEMVTGRLPFVGETPLSTAVMRLREEPVTPCAHVADLDPNWERAILACLTREPAARPASARAAYDLVAGKPSGRGRLRWIVPVLAGAFALALAWHLFGRQHPPTAEASRATAAPAVAPADHAGRRSVAVVGFKNLTGRTEANWISGALAEMISSELAASTDIRTIPSESVARAKRELGLTDEISFAPDTLAKLRSNLDTDFVLTGSYMALGKDSGGRIRFDLKLQDTRTGETVAVLSQTGNEADLVDLVAATGEALRSRLSLGELSPSEREGMRASMPRGDVLRLYTEGVAQLRIEACASARGPLEQAVAADPDFPLAHSVLAEALACLGYDARARAEAQRAVELSQRLPEHIRLEAQARAYEVGKDPTKAMDIYAKLFSQFPDSFEYGYKLASFQLQHLREDGLRKTIAALRQLPPPAGNSPRLDILEAYDDFFAGKSDDALAIAKAAYEQAEMRGERLVAANALVVQTHILNHLGRFDEAIAAVTEARGVFEAASDQDGIAKTLAVEASLREGKDGDSDFTKKAEDQIAAIAGTLRNPTELLRFRLVMGQRFSSKGNFDAALRAFADAREIAHTLGDEQLEAGIATSIAQTQMARGEIAEARKAVENVLRPGTAADTRFQIFLVQSAVEHAAGNTTAAKARLSDAEANLPDGGMRVLVDLMRSQFLCDEGNYKEAERIARQALVAPGARALAPLAGVNLTIALIGQKRWPEAAAAMASSGTSPFLSGIAFDLMLHTLSGRIKAATDLAGGRKELADALARATALDLKQLALDLRLQLALVEIDHGNAEKGRTLLAAVEADAHRLGLGTLERRAHRGE
jgi:tetratricopeptide (TPR) repeat protein/tRNA A-37 threonylcarbamoyl transferase component Bud32